VHRLAPAEGIVYCCIVVGLMLNSAPAEMAASGDYCGISAGWRFASACWICRSSSGRRSASATSFAHHSREVLPPCTQHRLVNMEPVAVVTLSFDDQVNVRMLLVGVPHHGVSMPPALSSHSTLLLPGPHFTIVEWWRYDI
jgi:hypothetical protein